MALFEIRHTIRHEIVPDAPTLALLRSAFSLLQSLEARSVTQQESFDQFKAATDATLADLGASLDQMASSISTIASAQANIAADEQRILDKLAQMGGLTPENQAILDAAVAGWQAVSAKAQSNAAAMQAAATSLQSLADSLPDEA